MADNDDEKVEPDIRGGNHWIIHLIAIFINITEFIQTLNVFNHIIDTYWKLHLVEKVKAERLA